MNEDTFRIDSDDGVKIFLRRYSPTGPARAVVQVVHGMAEHSLRYKRIAEKLCEEGIEVWASDHRGHGLTADSTINGPDVGGLLGHPSDRGGYPRVVKDLELISAYIAKEAPDLPLFLLGHSWGSFLSQAYIEQSGSRLAGVILSGTRGPGGLEILCGAPFAALVTALGAPRRYSPLLRTLAQGSYNRAFKPNRTDFDWLSRDDAEVDAYIADPLCGFRCSAAFYRDMTALLAHIHRDEALNRIPKDLPILIFCGSSDPVGLMGSSPSALVEAYRTKGIRDLEFIIYPEGRHEMLNETNREEVSSHLLSWLVKHLEA